MTLLKSSFNAIKCKKIIIYFSVCFCLYLNSFHHVCVVGVCCREFNISLPEKIEALSGSCVIIKCRFEIEDKYNTDLTERATGVWLKDGTDANSNVVFNSSTSSQISVIRGNITGKLKDKDCTTVFNELRSNHSGKYYFRIEGEDKLKWTYSTTHVSIDVMGEWHQDCWMWLNYDLLYYSTTKSVSPSLLILH